MPTLYSIFLILLFEVLLVGCAARPKEVQAGRVISFGSVCDPTHNEVALEDPGFPLWDVARVTTDRRYLVSVGPEPNDNQRVVFVVWDLWAEGAPVVHKEYARRDVTESLLGLNAGAGRVHLLSSWVPTYDSNLHIYFGVKLESPDWEQAGLFRFLQRPERVKAVVRGGTDRLGPIDTFAVPFPSRASLDTYENERVAMVVPFVRAHAAEGQLAEVDWVKFIFGWRPGRRGGIAAETLSPSLNLLAADTFVVDYPIWTPTVESAKQHRVVVWNAKANQPMVTYRFPDPEQPDGRYVTSDIGFSPDEDMWLASAWLDPTRLNPDGTGWAETFSLVVARTSPPWEAVTIDLPGYPVDAAWTREGECMLVLTLRNPGDRNPQVLETFPPVRVFRANLKNLSEPR